MDKERKIHEMLIKPEYFELVNAGIKKYEVRTNDERRKNMHVSDYIKLIKEHNILLLNF